jgi:Flp pilus assembly protein TadG
MDRFRSERGTSLVEFAFVLPLFMLIVTGMTTFGIAMNQYLELDNSTNIGAQQLAIARGTGEDACAEAVSAVKNAAPFLDSSQISYTITFTVLSTDTSGVTDATYTGAGSSAPTCPSASVDNMDAGGTVELQTQYPCTVTVYGGNLIPGCKLTSQVTEVMQ